MAMKKVARTSLDSLVRKQSARKIATKKVVKKVRKAISKAQKR